MELKGSRTEANLMAAFAGESQARNKYTFYAEQARQEGYEQIGDIFDETAHNERAHAELWLKFLRGGSIGDTMSNLYDAAGGEHFEWTEMYKEFAETAKQEGFTQIAAAMNMVGQIEKRHEERYRLMIERIEKNAVFEDSDAQTVWICRNCGYIHTGSKAPEACPVCRYPKSYFERRSVV